MVKNSKGGNKAKKFGRKFTNSGGNSVLRFSKSEDEIYACCSKIFGGSNIEVKCVDGKDRLCIMRNKFRGRGKRDNQISVGTWLLVGLRDFETVIEGKRENCDLLEVYNDSEKERLQQNEIHVDWRVLKEIKNIKETTESTSTDDWFEFTDKKTSEIEELVNNSNTSMIGTSIQEEDDSDVDINDI